MLTALIIVLYVLCGVLITAYVWKDELNGKVRWTYDGPFSCVCLFFVWPLYLFVPLGKGILWCLKKVSALFDRQYMKS